LAENGAIVYITGRTLKGPCSIEQTTSEIKERGGICIGKQVDHENDKQIEKLFEDIKAEQDGKLDILVNNAYKGVNTILEKLNLKFWEVEPQMWDDINGVGLRSHYICTVYAARLMVPKNQGLIVNISSMGGKFCFLSVPYGIGKAAVIISKLNYKIINIKHSLG
jgi:dehydrogenase/reductase SDR family protein 1